MKFFAQGSPEPQLCEPDLEAIPCSVDRSKGNHRFLQTRYLQKALAGVERYCGSEAVHTLRCRTVLAAVRSRNGKAYREFDRQTLTLQDKVLGPQHPDTLMTVHNLALDLANAGESAEAERLALRYVKGREETFGANHKFTCDAHFALAYRVQEGIGQLRNGSRSGCRRKSGLLVGYHENAERVSPTERT